jgi:hypothetical protein
MVKKKYILFSGGEDGEAFTVDKGWIFDEFRVGFSQNHSSFC